MSGGYRHTSSAHSVNIFCFRSKHTTSIEIVHLLHHSWAPTPQDMSLFDGGNFDPAARANGRFLPVESPMPGTTLGIIPLQAFVSGGTLYGMWMWMCTCAITTVSCIVPGCEWPPYLSHSILSTYDIHNPHRAAVGPFAASTLL